MPDEDLKWSCNPVDNSKHFSDGSNDSGIRVLAIPRSEIGFGFNVRGQIGEGGTMKAINGELYGPLHQVTALVSGGSAEKAGLKIEDRILEINDVNVEGWMHKAVIDMLRSSGNPLVLTVVTPLNGCFVGNPIVEGERCHVSIPEYQPTEEGGHSFIVYSIYINRRLACCRRYSHFHKLHAILKANFPQHHFVSLPGKKLFALNGEQLVERRRGLERFLVSVCSISEVFGSNIMKQFLLWDEEKETTTLVPMKVMMPNHSLLEVSVNPDEFTEQILARVANVLGLRTDALAYFSLFEISQENFERKLSAWERPYKIFEKHCECGLPSIISFKKWMFSPTREASLCRDPLVLDLVHSQAMERARSGEIVIGDREEEVENLNASGRLTEVMEIVRKLEGYGDISFPHCASDSRKRGRVVCSVSYLGLQLAAFTPAGFPENTALEFDWSRILKYEAQPNSFVFTFSRESKGPRTVTLFTKHSQYMLECFDCVLTERKGDTFKNQNLI